MRSTYSHRRVRIEPRLFRCLVALGAAVAIVAALPGLATAQTEEGWRVDLAPLYFWAASTSGNLALNGRTSVPVYLAFADAVSKVAGAFTFHVEARNGRWGVLADVNFIRLSSDVNYTTPILAFPIAGTVKMDQVIVNVKTMYEVKPKSNFFLVGGLRTMSMSPTAHFTGPVGGQLADIDVSQTVVAGVGGFVFRPRLAQRVVLLTQADIGGGSALTWSAVGGIEFQIKPWIGVAAGYGALRIDTGGVPTSGNAIINKVEYAVTQYGPAFSLTFHWSQK
jgi:hypothetical protein